MKLKRFGVLIIIFLFIAALAYFVVNNLGKEKIASLEVDSNTSNIDVLVDGKNVGKAPYIGTYEPKDVVVQIGDYQTRVTLQSGIKTIVDREFTSNNTSGSFGEVVSFEKTGLPTGSLAVVTDPGGAQVKVDGSPYGFTPINVNELTSGTHQLDISAEGYVDRSFPINIVNGYKLVAAVDLLSNSNTTATTPSKTNNLDQVLVQILSTPNDFLRVRSKPTTASDEVSQVHPGEKYQLLSIDKNSGWFEIQLTATSSGWISNIYASTSSGAIKN